MRGSCKRLFPKVHALSLLSLSIGDCPESLGAMLVYLASSAVNNTEIFWRHDEKARGVSWDAFAPLEHLAGDLDHSWSVSSCSSSFFEMSFSFKVKQIGKWLWNVVAYLFCDLFSGCRVVTLDEKQVSTYSRAVWPHLQSKESYSWSLIAHQCDLLIVSHFEWSLHK